MGGLNRWRRSCDLYYEFLKIVNGLFLKKNMARLSEIYFQIFLEKRFCVAVGADPPEAGSPLRVGVSGGVWPNISERSLTTPAR